MLNKDIILERAYEECMAEMYSKAQPSADWYQILRDCKEGKIKKDEKIYERYYLSQEEFKHIQNKYLDAYRLKDKWIEYVEIVEDYLKKGGVKDKYIPEQIDENGNEHPGYHSYENVKPIKEQIEKILNDVSGEVSSFIKDAIRDKIVETVMNTISDCREFYRFGRRDEDSFCYSTALGPSPTSNPQTVIDYWKTQGIDLEIEIRNPLLLWERDYYGDEFEEVMEDEYGENWKEQFDLKWKEELAKKEANKKKLLETIENGKN